MAAVWATQGRPAGRCRRWSTRPPSLRTWGSRRRLWREVFSTRRAGWLGVQRQHGHHRERQCVHQRQPGGAGRVQVAFVQQGGSLAQTATLSAGQYTVSFKAAQRGNYQLGAQAIEVRVDGVAVGQYQAPTTAYGAYQTAPFNIANTGAHTVTLVGVGGGGVDFTGFIDDVRIGAPVAPAATTTGLASSANPAVAGVSVTLTATVTGAAPTGVVQFADNGAVIGGCGAVALAGSGNSRTATCSTASLAVGTRTITASYGGDGVNAGSISSALSQVINAGRRSRTWGSRRRLWREVFSMRRAGLAGCSAATPASPGTAMRSPAATRRRRKGCRWRSCSRVAAFRRRRT
ncbi:MAG: Ig-like domain repeat protein [Betaproteobacteria bacterium]|nr:Ig-like domain repeat protein [Betaproteobacteria bacterium]